MAAVAFKFLVAFIYICVRNEIGTADALLCNKQGLFFLCREGRIRTQNLYITTLYISKIFSLSDWFTPHALFVIASQRCPKFERCLLASYTINVKSKLVARLKKEHPDVTQSRGAVPRLFQSAELGKWWEMSHDKLESKKDYRQLVGTLFRK